MRINKILIFILASILLYSCDADSNFSSDTSSDQGTSGSLARFAIANNYLYTVELEQLKIFDISNEQKPAFITQIYPGFGIETIFVKGDYLFLGSKWGVYIYDISTPTLPKQLSLYSHVYSCDPVIVSGNYAYSTLNSSGPCGRGLNQLDVIDISDKSHPDKVYTIEMESPKGLGVSGDLLFVCDNGIKVFDISDPETPQFISKENINAFDVITIDNLLIVVSESGLYEYEFNSNGELNLKSTLYSKN